MDTLLGKAETPARGSASNAGAEEAKLHEFWHILSDPAHMGAEIVSHVLISAAAYPLIRIAVRLHDRAHHNK